MLTEAEAARIKRLPEQIEGTLDKLNRLLTKAEAVGYRPADWAEQWDALQSRFLTDPKMIDREWERTIERARNANGEK